MGVLNFKQFLNESNYMNSERQRIIDLILDKNKMTELDKELIYHLSKGDTTIGQLSDEEQELYWDYLQSTDIVNN
jgi:hypothetical protein